MTAEQPIINAIQALLNNSTSVTATVSTRIYDTMAPQDPTQPFILTTVVSDPVQGYFDAKDDLGPMQMQVDIFGKIEAGIKTVRQLGDTVYAALHRQTFTATGYTGCSLICVDRGQNMDQDLIIGGRTQQDAWRQTQTYDVYGTGS